MTQDWPRVALGEVLKYRKQFIYIDDSQTYKRCRVQWYGKGAVLRDIVQGSEIKTKEQQICSTNEFLVAEIDAKEGGYGVVPPELDGSIVSSHYFLFTINEDLLDPRFLKCFIQTSNFFDQVVAKGTTNYAAIRPTDVLHYQIPLPTLEEQQRIVARIESLAERVNAARGLREKAAVESQRILTTATKKLFSPSKSNNWQYLTVENCCENIIDYRGRTPPVSESGIPHLTSANIKNGNIDWDNTKYVSEETYLAYMTRGLPQIGDIIFTMEAPLGEAAVVTRDCRFSLAQRTILFRNQAQLIDSFFMARALTSPDVRETIYANATGTTVKGIAAKRLKYIKLPVPPLAEQRRIVAYLDGLQARVDAVRQLQTVTAAGLESLLPSILDRAFKGEL